MVKIILLNLILGINIYAQIELTSSKKYLNIDGADICIIELNLKNISDSNLVLYTNNWRLSYLNSNSEKFLGFPVIPNLINRIIIHPSEFEITKQYLGEDSNLGIIIKESMQCLNPLDEITLNIVLQDSSTIKLIKNNYIITYIYNYAYLSDVKSIVKLDMCSDQKNQKFIFPLRPINSNEVRHHIIIEDENMDNKNVDFNLNSKFIKCIGRI